MKKIKEQKNVLASYICRICGKECIDEGLILLDDFTLPKRAYCNSCIDKLCQIRKDKGEGFDLVETEKLLKDKQNETGTKN